MNEQIMLNQMKQEGFTLHFSICTICLYIIVWDVFKCGREFSFPVLKMHFLGVSEGKLVWGLSGNLLPPSTKDPFFGRLSEIWHGIYPISLTCLAAQILLLRQSSLPIYKRTKVYPLKHFGSFQRSVGLCYNKYNLQGGEQKGVLSVAHYNNSEARPDTCIPEDHFGIWR